MRRHAAGALWGVATGAVLAVIALAAAAPHEAYADAEVLLGAARAVLAGASPYGSLFQSPLWTALLLAPFAALPGTAGPTAWFWANIACWLAAAGLLLTSLLGRRPAATLALTTGLLAIYPPVIWSAHGQVVSFMALGVALFIRLVAARPLAAGAALALLLAKPHLALFPIGLLLLWSWRTGRLGAIAGLALAACLLAGAAFAVQPSWLGEWMTELTYPPAEMVAHRALYAATVAGLAGLWMPGYLASALGLLVGVATVLWAARWVWRWGAQAEAPQVAALAAATLFLAAPYSQGYDLSLLLFTLAFVAAQGWPPSRGSALQLALVMGVYLFPTLLAFTGWPQPVLSLSAPLAVAAWSLASWSGAAPAPLPAGQLAPEKAGP